MTMSEQCCNLANRRLTDYIPPTTFRSRTLILDNNALTSIRNVKYCTSLQQLSVCHNQVVDMSPVGNLPQLNLLHLIDNVIHTIAGVGECGELSELNLSRNCLQSFTGLYHCTALRKLDLSYNSITCLVDITSLTSLQELYLHGNELCTLESAPLCLPICISVLSLADNRIADIGQLAYLTRLKTLESLSLVGNVCSNSNSRPYQIFAVMCCPNLVIVDQEYISAQHREHARVLEKKMLMSGESSFSAVRDERPRTAGRHRSQTDLGRYKENNSFVANIASRPRADHVTSSRVSGHVTSVSRDVLDDQRSTYSAYSTSPTNSNYSAYDEYNDRPAMSGAVRVRSRRSSDATSPRHTPTRDRAKSLFTVPPEPLTEPPEEEMLSESVYVGVEEAVSSCLDNISLTSDTTHHNISDEVNSTLISSHHLDHIPSPAHTTPTGSSHSANSRASKQHVAFFVDVDGGASRDASSETSRDKSRDSSSSFFISLEEEEGVPAVYSEYEVECAITIQAVWRGCLARRRNVGLLKDLALTRYQSCFREMEGQISELSSALSRERELSTLYRHMIKNLCKRVRQPPTRPRSTQTTQRPHQHAHVQTDSLISTLIASLSVLEDNNNITDNGDTSNGDLSFPSQTELNSPGAVISPKLSPAFKSPFTDLLIQRSSPRYGRTRSSSLPGFRESARLRSSSECEGPPPLRSEHSPERDDDRSKSGSPNTPSSLAAGVLKDTLSKMRSDLLIKQPNLNNDIMSNCTSSPNSDMRSSLEQFRSIDQLINETS